MTRRSLTGYSTTGQTPIAQMNTEKMKIRCTGLIPHAITHSRC